MVINSYNSIAAAFVFCIIFSATVIGQSTAFTYQGKLIDGGTAANGQYDLTFRLFNASAGGTQVGTDVVRDNVQVTAGIFTVNLDFDSSPFTSASGNFLEISIRPGASTGSFTPLSPLQPLTSSPYAVQTIRAASAAVADNAVQLGGVNASEYVQTNDTRMNDARTPLAGSADYIQSNPATQQPGTNLNIGGDATVGGTLSGNVLNAATQYNIGGNRVLSVAGAENFFAGLGAGQSNSASGFNNSFAGNLAGAANTTGGRNAFFGSSAGAANISGFDNSFFGNLTGTSSTGGGNSFFGATAGPSNTTGGDNSFFGNIAGQLNTSGTNNAFFGVLAGRSNTTGSSNTILGSNANVGSGNLSNATAIGAGSVVSTSDTVVLGRNSDTVRVPGNLTVTGTFTGNFTVPANNVTGVLSASQGGTGIGPGFPPANTYLRSNGAGWQASGLQASDIPAGSTDYIQNIPGIGQQSASFNITGGGTANILNAVTQYNIRGFRVLSVSGLTIFGATNTFAGAAAGTNNATGESNSYFGQQAGTANNASHGNSFFGRGAGSQNLGGSNSFFGVNTGVANTTGSSNALFGANANVGSADLSNATAIGANAIVSQSNSLVLGSNANVGIGTSSPNAKLQIAGGSVYIQQPNSLVITSPNGACWFITVNDAGALSTIPVGCP